MTDLRHFVVYRSSAGSGKTFTLVREYIKLAIKSPDNFRHVLAVTFTNKAANEMKERVINYLQELSDYDPIHSLAPVRSLMEMLIKETGHTEQQVKQEAKLVLTRIIHQYSDFSIGTIDSFVHRLIRTFARDLSLPMNFEVELDGDAFLQKALEELISKVGVDEKLTRVLLNFLESKTEDEGHWDIEKDLLATAKVLLKEDGQIYVDLLKDLDVERFISIRAELNKIIRAFEESLKKMAGEALEYLEDKSLTNEHLAQGSKGIASYFSYLLKGRTDKLEPSETVKKLVASHKVLKDKLPQPLLANIEEINEKILDYYSKITDFRLKEEAKWNLAMLVRQKLFQIAVLNEIRKIIDEFRDKDAIMHISEFNRRVAQIVLDQSAPFIYERVGERYTNFLIDEFQDTSLLQWQNLIPLIVNSLASGGFNLIVGDSKQAIYRWRSGELEQFQMLPRVPGDHIPIIRERAIALKNNFEEVKLQINYRSCRQIINFNNRFFLFVRDFIPENYRPVYSDVEQSGNIDGDGYIRIEFIDPKLDKKEKARLNCLRVLEIAKEYKSRTESYKGLAVLCRTNEEGSLVSRTLMSEGINVISSESLLLSVSPRVNLILAMLRFLHNPADQVSLAKILEYLSKFMAPGGRDLYQVFSKITSLSGVSSISDLFKNSGTDLDQRLSELVMIQEKPLFDKIEGIVRILQLNSNPDPYVIFFLDAVFEQTSKGINSTEDLLEWWEEKKGNLSLIVPEGLDAVQVMTIHKAKGLQFPAVIYPFANESVRPTMSEFWIEPGFEEVPELKAALVKNNNLLGKTKFQNIKSLEDEKSIVDLLNLLYVVLTRPEKELYIISETAEPSSSPNSIPSFLNSFLKFEHSDNHSDIYEFGSHSPVSEEKKAKTNIVFLKNQISEDWHGKFRIRLNAPAYWDTEDSEYRREFGNIVHQVLSELISPDQLDIIVNNYVLTGVLEEDSALRIKEIIKNLLGNEKMKFLFDPDYQILNEAEILTAEGSSYRPDRLLIRDKEVIIIDFKTGKKDFHHTNQVNGYAKILGEMGYNVKAKFLIYLSDEVELIRIP